MPAEGWAEYVNVNVEAWVAELADAAVDDRNTGLKAFPLQARRGISVGAIRGQRAKARTHRTTAVRRF